jgi:hypothetical protein
VAHAITRSGVSSGASAWDLSMRSSWHGSEDACFGRRRRVVSPPATTACRSQPRSDHGRRARRRPPRSSSSTTSSTPGAPVAGGLYTVRYSGRAPLCRAAHAARGPAPERRVWRSWAMVF